jgi:CRP-like cAMP-binding protein
MGAEEDIGIDVILDLFRKMRYEFKTKGDTIYCQGDPPNDKMYILIAGEIGFLEKDPDRPNKPHREPMKNPKIVFLRMESQKSALSTIRTPASRKTGKSSHRHSSSRRPSHASSIDSFGELPESPDKLDKHESPGSIDSFDFAFEGENESPTKVTLNSINNAKRFESLDQVSNQGTAKNLTIMSGLIKSKIALKHMLNLKQNLMNTMKKYGSLKGHMDEGAFFGDQVLFTKMKRPNTAVALRNSDLLVINKEDFKELRDLVHKKH